MFALPRRYAEEMIAHAREEAPNECCGVLAGKDGEAQRLYRAANSEKSPYRYNIDSQDLYRIYSDARANGWEFLAIYHSHPQGAACPSATDIALAQWQSGGESVDRWPGVLYLIISLANEAAPEVRAFRIESGVATEESLRFVD